MHKVLKLVHHVSTTHIQIRLLNFVGESHGDIELDLSVAVLQSLLNSRCIRIKRSHHELVPKHHHLHQAFSCFAQVKLSHH